MDFLSANKITDNYSTLMTETDKETENRKKHFQYFLNKLLSFSICTPECKALQSVAVQRYEHNNSMFVVPLLF